ncbi:MAG TPA: cupin domain-containing protein [Cyanobacteria bacterium UBA11369]|nr:cupin domain-containing protein [Cyanobacteria bacterium UBA11371]HBE34546.1 cupin domain-containing protein [Cyanobacteria bacterium UBA11368]HBE48062.1 cupin domain-containing protein [Cyanobacteria bacterium UBA11369]
MSNSTTSVLIPTGKGRLLWWGDILVTFKVLGEETDGAFAVMEDIVPPHYATPPHVHSREDERVYVVSGEFAFQVGNETFNVSAGDYINMPRHLVHNFRNIGDTQGILLVTFSPAGIEEMFYEMGRDVDDPSTPPPPYTPEEMKNIIAIAAKHGVEIKSPPRS